VARNTASLSAANPWKSAVTQTDGLTILGRLLAKRSVVASTNAENNDDTVDQEQYIQRQKQSFTALAMAFKAWADLPDV
jgi:hypothetical protein